MAPLCYQRTYGLRCSLRCKSRAQWCFHARSHFGDLSNIDDELILVCRQYGDSEPGRGARLVECGPENFNHRYTAVAWQVEKRRLC
jgi:hypothetical protein